MILYACIMMALFDPFFGVSSLFAKSIHFEIQIQFSRMGKKIGKFYCYHEILHTEDMKQFIYNNYQTIVNAQITTYVGAVKNITQDWSLVIFTEKRRFTRRRSDLHIIVNYCTDSKLSLGHSDFLLI